MDRKIATITILENAIMKLKFIFFTFCTDDISYVVVDEYVDIRLIYI